MDAHHKRHQWLDLKVSMEKAGKSGQYCTFLKGAATSYAGRDFQLPHVRAARILGLNKVADRSSSDQ
jgi:hypothetical protein